MKNFNLNMPLLDLGGISLTFQKAVEGFQIFGGTGSGKTSGSGYTLAMNLLKEGCGGIVLIVKHDETVLWQKYCQEAGRLNDLIIVGKNHQNYFNFLEYESRDGQSTQNIMEVLKTVIYAAQDKEQGKANDAFWENSLDLLISHVIDLCLLADGKVSIKAMYDIVQSLPKISDTDRRMEGVFYKTFSKAKKNVLYIVEKEGSESPEARSLKAIDQFLLDTYFNLSEKTRSIVDFSFTGFLHQFLQEPIYSLFCERESNFTPDDCLKGKIIVLDLPIKLHHKTGRDCQILLKYIWQRAMERRVIEDDSPAAFLWVDEAQNFLHEKDTAFQSTARSSRVVTVNLTQNLPNYYANMGGAKYKHHVETFLGTLNTKFFHANTDVETNKYASELIGDGFHVDIALNYALNGEGGNINRAPRIDKAVRPEVFNSLKTGSSKNGGKVEAILHMQDQLFKDGKNYLRVRFTQKKQ